MDDIWIRIVEHMSDLVTGPMTCRLILQPVMASIFAIIAGLNDAKLGSPPYFWSLINKAGHRVEMVRDGCKSAGKVFVLATLCMPVRRSSWPSCWPSCPTCSCVALSRA